MIMMETAPFGVTKAGEKVSIYTMRNSAGMTVKLLDYGCTVQSLLVPDKDGTLRDVVLGYDTLEAYEKGTCFFGTFVGRYANRILNSEFELDGETYRLPANDGRNHLHGTYCSRVFSASCEENRIVFSGVSPDGEEGFPGKLSFHVIYELTEDNRLIIEYYAATDAPTVVNFTNHSYFNLEGQTDGTVARHVLSLNASLYTEGTEETVPTGRLLPVAGTPMDYRTAPAVIGEKMDMTFPQLAMCSGYDHNFVIDGEAGTLRPAAKLFSPESGITMTCLTTQPGVQFYSGNFIKGDSAVGKNGIRHPAHGALCLETQHYPCSPNFPEFPSTVLRPGETYHEITAYAFER